MLSRLARLKEAKDDDDYYPDTPQIDCSEYLIGYLFEFGPLIYGPMGSAPVTHAELAAWQYNIGIRLTPWEVRLLHHLSRAYINELQASADIQRPSPWDDTEVERVGQNRKTENMRAAIRAMAKPKK